MQKEHKKCTTSLMIWPQKLARQTAQLTTRKRTKKPQCLGLKSTTSLIIFAQQQAKKKWKHLYNLIYIWHRPQLHQQKKHKKCTTSLMIWPQKLAQQTSQLHQQKKHKKCTTSLMIWPQKLAQQTAQLTTRNTKKNTTFRLKKHNFPAQKITTAAPPQIPGCPETCSRLGPASPAWAWILLEGRATR